MNKILFALLASFSTLILLAAMPAPQGPQNAVQVCPGCLAFSAGLPPTCPGIVGVTIDRKIFRPGLCACVGAECLQARACLAAYQMTVTDAAGAHVFSAITNVCGGYAEAHPTGQGCAPGFIFATCTPCAKSCL